VPDDGTKVAATSTQILCQKCTKFSLVAEIGD